MTPREKEIALEAAATQAAAAIAAGVIKLRAASGSKP